MKKSWLFASGLLFLLAVEILRVYFIMPFPGSQRSNTIALAYFLNRHIVLLRVIGFLWVIFPLVFLFRRAGVLGKIGLMIPILFYLTVAYLFSFKFVADRIFYPPQLKQFAGISSNQVSLDRLVIGVSLNGQARAYPIQIIGYHHQVPDTVGGIPILVTYCTVCRTGRVYSPMVKGRPAVFRLVGMDHFNAMFEDKATGSWWQQESGMALAGPLKGQFLPELPSRQMRLGSWLREYPQSEVLQPDPHFTAYYADLQHYDLGTIRGSLERRDSASWHPKSWVIGILAGDSAKAYDWNLLVNRHLISDRLGSVPLILYLEKDGMSFHAWSRMVKGSELQLEEDSSGDLIDQATQSHWDQDGLCTSGPLAGTQLENVPAYQEFWHSWGHFHPNTTVFVQ